VVLENCKCEGADGLPARGVAVGAVVNVPGARLFLPT
jgi:hypothetical protein